jgi:sec-independent protein translocase protein TatA
MLLVIPAGMEWLLIILVIGVMFFGVKKIPQLARSLGSATSEFEKAKIQADKELSRLKTGDDDRAENRDRLQSIADTHRDKP